MSDRFLKALVDALIPGGPVAETVNLPPASAVGTDHCLDDALAHDEPPLAAIIALVAERAGGGQSFAAATTEQQVAILHRVQAEHPDGFANLLSRTLSYYYEHPEVCAAFHWPGRPPQPAGHTLRAFDEQLLAPVRARGELWRKT